MATNYKQLVSQLQQEVKSLRHQLTNLQTDNHRLQQQLEDSQAENQCLKEQLKEALRAAARQAGPFRRSEKNKVPPEKKKRPGRKKGHRGSYRPKPEKVDHTIPVPLGQCPHCGGPVHNCRQVVQYIEEIPPVQPVVYKVITERGHCPSCGPVASTHPLLTASGRGANSVQLGPRTLGWIAALNKKYNLTIRQTCNVLEGLTGIRVSPGGVSQALARIAGKMKKHYEDLVGSIRASPVVYADETSWWVGSPGWWLWVFTTPNVTLYRVEAERSSQIVKDTLGEDFAGVLVSDCLSSYDPPDCAKHKCIAHHCKAIADEREAHDAHDSEYLKSWKLFFTAVRVLCKMHDELSQDEWAARVQGAQSQCDKLLDQVVTAPADVKIQNRLLRQRAHLLGCLKHPGVEPTNNRAERALRPAVVARKLSCGNKTERGRRTWEILTSLAATCQQKEEDYVDFLMKNISLTAFAG